MKEKEIAYDELLQHFDIASNTINNCAIEITNACNFKCDHCYIEKERIKFMSFEKFEKIVQQLIDMNCISILLTGGEVLLHPEFERFYKYVKEKGFFVSVNTNGYLINDQIIKLFEKYKPYVVEISLYGYNEKSYAEYVYQKDSFLVINENIEKLQEKNIFIKTKALLTKRNMNHFHRIKEYAYDKKVDFRYDYIVFPKINTLGSNGNPERLETAEIIDNIKGDEQAKIYFENEIEKIGKHENFSEFIFECTGGEDSVFINCHGNINMCVIVQTDQHNIEKVNINDAMKEIKKFKNKKKTENNKCYQCEKKNICRYCPGRFYLETNDYQLAPHWYCNMAEEIIKNFQGNKIYDKKNKIPNNILNEMFGIISSNLKMNSINQKIKESDYDLWKENVLDSKELLTYVEMDEGRVIGYIQFIKGNMDSCICEIQVIDKNKGDGKTFRKLLSVFVDTTKLKNTNKVFVNINKNNQKAILIFEKIGFVHMKNNRYEISGEKLINWLKKEKKGD